MKRAQTFSRLFATSSSLRNPKQNQRVISEIRPVSAKSAKEIHAQLIRTQLHTDAFSISPVIKAYALSSSHLHQARLVFNQLQQPTLLTFNHLIRGLSQSDNPDEAINFYVNEMYNQGLPGDNLTFIYLSKACARAKCVVLGRVIHTQSLKLGFVSYLYLSNALISMYAGFGDLVLARKMFDEMGDRDLVSWNSLICGYGQWSRFDDVLGLFNSMREVAMKADAVTMVKVLLACGRVGNRETEDALVKCIEDNGVYIDVYLGNILIDIYGRRGSVDLAQGVFDRMQDKNVVSWNSMIKVYAKVGDLVAARRIFYEMPRRDVISWTCIIAGYVQTNQFSDAILLFQEMMQANVKPDEITVASMLSACAHVGSLRVGKAVHEYIRVHGIKEDLYVGNTLIDMYSKCGAVKKALEVFHGMKVKDDVSWNSMISGLAVNGFADDAVELFSQMLRDGVWPTHSSFIGALLACTHAGLVDKGLEFFEIMERVYGLTPEMKHYGIIVDLLSRSGNLDRAYEFVKAMKIVPDVVIWRILLSACKLHGNLVLAEIVTERLLELDPSNSGNYVLLSTTYAGSDRWDKASEMRTLMEEGHVLKPSGWSSIEIN